MSIVVAVALFIVLFLICIICICCCRNRSTNENTRSVIGASVYNATNRPRSGVEFVGQHADPTGMMNGGIKLSHEAPYQSQILPPHAQQQHQQPVVLPSAKSMGDLFQPHQLPPSSPMLRHFQDYPTSPQPAPPPTAAWNMQPVCCPPTQQHHQTSWYPQQSSQQIQLASQNQSSTRVSGTLFMCVLAYPSTWRHLIFC